MNGTSVCVSPGKTDGRSHHRIWLKRAKELTFWPSGYDALSLFIHGQIVYRAVSCYEMQSIWDDPMRRLLGPGLHHRLHRGISCCRDHDRKRTGNFCIVWESPRPWFGAWFKLFLRRSNRWIWITAQMKPCCVQFCQEAHWPWVHEIAMKHTGMTHEWRERRSFRASYKLLICDNTDKGTIKGSRFTSGRLGFFSWKINAVSLWSPWSFSSIEGWSTQGRSASNTCLAPSHHRFRQLITWIIKRDYRRLLAAVMIVLRVHQRNEAMQRGIVSRDLYGIRVHNLIRAKDISSKL